MHDNLNPLVTSCQSSMKFTGTSSCSTTSYYFCIFLYILLLFYLPDCFSRLSAPLVLEVALQWSGSSCDWTYSRAALAPALESPWIPTCNAQGNFNFCQGNCSLDCGKKTCTSLTCSAFCRETGLDHLLFQSVSIRLDTFQY